jgi:hypothetical protein
LIQLGTLQTSSKVKLTLCQPVLSVQGILPLELFVMARYTCSFVIAVPFERLNDLLIEVLEACNLDVIYNTSDYMMGREKTGRVSFAKLVTVEVLTDKTTATEKEVRMNIVVKNEELPLQVNNHCHQMFDVVCEAIAKNRHWQLVESVVG